MNLPDVLPFAPLNQPADKLVWVSLERLAYGMHGDPEAIGAALRNQEGALLLATGGQWFVAFEKAKLSDLGIDYRG